MLRSTFRQYKAMNKSRQQALKTKAMHLIIEFKLPLAVDWKKAIH